MSVLARLAALVSPADRVALDGPDAAGKTTLADALAALVPGAARLSADDFLRPARERRAGGDLSPSGYYADAFDNGALTAAVGAAGAPLVVDGVFLQRPQLRPLWTLTVWLDIPPAETLRRAVVRDLDRFGSAAEVERRYRARYLPAQDLYRAEAHPLESADVVLDMSDPQAPVVVRWPTVTS
jgi:uridine kinase